MMAREKGRSGSATEAADYEGAHRILPKCNRLLSRYCEHTNRIVELAREELIVAAADDHASRRARTQALVRTR